VTWENWAAGFFTTYCGACHSENTEERNGAPAGIDFDTEEQVAEWSAAIRSSVLDRESMPVGGGIYDDDRALLTFYLDCGITP